MHSTPIITFRKPNLSLLSSVYRDVRTDMTTANNPTPTTEPSPETSFGLRAIRRDKTNVATFVQAALHTRFGRRRPQPHTVWVSGKFLFAVTGFSTEAFELDTLTFTPNFRGTKVTISAPDNTDVMVSSRGAAWSQFFCQLQQTHPEAKIELRPWVLTVRSDERYEYFER